MTRMHVRVCDTLCVCVCVFALIVVVVVVVVAVCMKKGAPWSGGARVVMSTPVPPRCAFFRTLLNEVFLLASGLD